VEGFLFVQKLIDFDGNANTGFDMEPSSAIFDFAIEGGEVLAEAHPERCYCRSSIQRPPSRQNVASCRSRPLQAAWTSQAAHRPSARS
jgi:hypothetical protein